MNVKTNLDYLKGFVSDNQMKEYSDKVESVFDVIYGKTGAGNDFLGWVTLPGEIDTVMLEDIKATAEDLRRKSDVFVVVGIGGSYLGARAVIEALGSHFTQLMGEEKTQIVYAGNNMSEDYLADLLHLLDKKEYSMTVISKSGTTTEPAVAFRILKII